jgi:hypothetical protein
MGDPLVIGERGRADLDDLGQKVAIAHARKRVFLQRRIEPPEGVRLAGLDPQNVLPRLS